MPGNVNPIDRFVRATYFLRLLPESKNQREAAAGMFSVVRNVSVPFGAIWRVWRVQHRISDRERPQQ
nr:linear amide C-N hydrolase [Methylocystis echinoides]